MAGRLAADEDCVSLRLTSAVAVLAVVACLAAGGAILVRHGSGRPRIPTHRPAVDAAGAAGWVWSDGLPGWRPGQMVGDYPVSGVQPVEVAAAQLAAAHAVLDSRRVRVLASVRPDRRGVLAVLAAPTLYETPTTTCLAVMLRGDEPVVWRCPGPHELSDAHVFGAAATMTWTAPSGATVPGAHPLYLVGVARGDVDRVVLADGPSRIHQTLYERGSTWGEFEAAVATADSVARLLVYGHGRLLETVRLDLAPGDQRVFQ